MDHLPASRMPLGALLTIVLMVGCTTAPAAPKPPEDVVTRVVKAGAVRLKNPNQGRVLGTVVADAAVLEWAGVTTLAGAEAQAFDQDGNAISEKVKIDEEGHFILMNFKESRGVVYVEADVNGLRYRTLAPAPRERRDYGVTLDAATTFLADKLRRSAIDQEVLLEKLDGIKLDETEDLVNVFMDQEDRRDVLEQDERDLNAFAFDHFMDDHIPVKVAVYQLAPSVLRGWRPNLPRLEPPTPKPTVRPTPVATPSVAVPTPAPSSTGPAPK